jgi:hypothetical protein
LGKNDTEREREEETTKQRQHKQDGPRQSRSSERELVKEQVKTKLNLLLWMMLQKSAQEENQVIPIAQQQFRI